VLAVFHLNNKEAKRALKVNHNNETLPFFSEPTYLGVTLGRTLTYRRQFKSLGKKLTPRVALLRRLAGSGWGVAATTLRTATLSLVHSTTGYCDPVWCCSAHTHFIDPATNDALRTVAGLDACVLQRKGWRALRNSVLSSPTHRHHPEIALPRRVWVLLNHLRTSVRRFPSFLHKWGMAASAACECCRDNQTVEHVFKCPIHRPPYGLYGLTVLNDEIIDWLLNTCPEI